MTQKKKQGDFRYAAGDAKVPWHAVGECFTPGDVLEIVRFLMPPGADATEYRRKLAAVRAGILALAATSLPATKLTLGKCVTQAEELARNYLQVKHACLLSNWTAGMEIGYKLAGLRPGDEVIVPAITFVATMAYPLTIGAKIVFVDVDPVTLNLSPEDLARKITSRTRVIVPVHIGGYACDMDAIMEIAAAADIWVMEDAAHALGATYKGRHLGTIGHFGGYSLHEVKNINSLGEGGLLVSNLALGEQFTRARFLGLDFSRRIPDWLYDVSALEDRYGRPQVAGNYSVTELQALGFCLQFARLGKIIAKRREHAQFLTKALAQVPGILPPPADTAETRSSHHLYPLRIDPKVLGADIRALKAKLKEKGVTEIAHFGPMYMFRVLEQLGYDRRQWRKSCPNTEYVFYQGFTHLPLYPMTREQLEYMAGAVAEAATELRAGARPRRGR